MEPLVVQPQPAGDLQAMSRRSALTASRSLKPSIAYHGIERNHMWLSVRVAALNLRRLLILGLTRRDEAWVLA